MMDGFDGFPVGPLVYTISGVRSIVLHLIPDVDVSDVMVSNDELHIQWRVGESFGAAAILVPESGDSEIRFCCSMYRSNDPDLIVSRGLTFLPEDIMRAPSKTRYMVNEAVGDVITENGGGS